jgi:hypothetical protein
VIALLLAALLAPPVPAARIAAALTGASETALVQIVRRESAGQRVGVHERDAKWSEHVCRRARQVGWLGDVDCGTGGWSTRGTAGLMAAYNLRWLGLSRWPWVLDVPAVSAVAAARKWKTVCAQARRDVTWCPEKEA